MCKSILITIISLLVPALSGLAQTKSIAPPPAKKKETSKVDTAKGPVKQNRKNNTGKPKTSSNNNNALDNYFESNKPPVNATIQNLWFEDGVKSGSEDGVNLHASLRVQNMRDGKGLCSVYFYDNNYNPVTGVNSTYSTNGSNPQVAVSKAISPGYDDTTYDDLVLFIPYSALNQSGSYPRDLKAEIVVWDSSNGYTQLTDGDYYTYTFDPKVMSTASVEINKVWTDHNVYDDGKKGLKIHVDMNAINVKNHKIQTCVYFYYTNGNPLKDTDGSYKTPDGSVATHKESTVLYDNSHFSDLSLFFPYNQLHLGSGKTNLKYQVEVYDTDLQKFIGKSDWQYFDFTK